MLLFNLSFQVANQSIWKLFSCHNTDIAAPMLLFYANTNSSPMKNFSLSNGTRKTLNFTGKSSQAMLESALEWPRVPQSVLECPRVLQSAPESPEFLRVLQSPECFRVLQS